MKHILLLSLLLTGCASVGKQQASCESQYSKFKDIYSCVKSSFASNDRALRNPNVKLYLLKGEQLSGQIDNNQISEIDAKVEWQKLYVQLKSTEEAEMASTYVKPVKPTSTTCMPVGNSVRCNTY